MTNEKNRVAETKKQYTRRGMLRLVYALTLILATCPDVTVAAGAQQTPDNKPGTQYQATESSAAFMDFQRILTKYPDLIMDAQRKKIIQDAGKTLKEFEKDVAVYVIRKNENEYIRKEEGDYNKLVQEIKLLRLAVTRISEKAEVLHEVLLRFAKKSIQTALNNEAYNNDNKLTPEKAGEAYRNFSLEVLRMFAQDLLAFRCHASWLDNDLQSESANRAPHSIAVSQLLSCTGNNQEIIMCTEAAHQLWTRQVEMEEGDLFVLSDFPELENAYFTDPFSRYEWSAVREKAKKDLAALQQEWTGVKKAYSDYMNAWAEAFAPVPGSSGSGAPYWCADMCMHILSHWEGLVSYMLFHNQSEIPAVNKKCFLLSLPGTEAKDFADVYISKLTDTVKRLADETDSTEIESSMECLHERVARLYDARMRYAIASISCKFYGDDEHIATETEKARLLIREKMLQDVAELCALSATNNEADTPHGVYASHNGMSLWRKQMRLLVSEIGKSYELSSNPEPFSGENIFRVPSFSESDTHVERIQDLLEETEEAWDWYRRSWNSLLCSLSGIDSDILEYRLYELREQWLHFLFSRAYD